MAFKKMLILSVAKSSAFPLGSREESRNFCDRGSNIQQRGIFKSGGGGEIGSETEERYGHILGEFGAVSTVMTAVVGHENNGIFVAEKFNNALDVVNCNRYAAEIFVAHPNVIVTAFFIGLHHVEENEIGFVGVYGLYCLVGESGIAAFNGIGIDVGGKLQSAGKRDITKRFPAVKHGGNAAVVAYLLKESGHGAHLRNVGVGENAVALRCDRMCHGKVTGEGDGGHHRT